MDSYKLVEKLQSQANVSYEEAKNALEKTNWDILDAIVYLEQIGKMKKPSMSIFYTNEYKENYKNSEITKNEEKKNNYKNQKKGNTFGGVFEAICKIIDACNKIFFEIKKENISFIKVPITVIILLFIFAFWIVIPLFIVGLFFDIEFSISGNTKEINKLNQILKMMSVNVKKVKEGLKKGFKND